MFHENHEFIESDWLKRWNNYSPNKVALIDAKTDSSWTYSELYQSSLKLAHFLKNKHGVKKGDRIAVLSENSIYHIPLFFAVARLGAILVPINFRLRAPEIEYIVTNCRAKLLFYSKTFEAIVTDPVLCQATPSILPTDGAVDSLEDICGPGKTPEPLSFDAEFTDPCMILYTSGTTGFPKGAVLTHKMVFWNSINTSLRLQLTNQDVQICFLPFFHTGGWNVLLLPTLHQGGTNIIVEKFDPKLIIELTEKHKATILFGVPTTMDMMVQNDAFLSAEFGSVRYAIVGGEPMPLNLIKTWGEKGVPIRQGYGLTEFGPNVFSLNEEDAIRKIGSIGFPNFYIDVKVVAEDGSECLANEVGELLLKGPMCMAGYWNNPEATSETIRDGWLHTGDLVKFDEDGYYYVVGRKKEMFISGGENVYPVEVEQVISKHESVHEVAVVGVPDQKWGEVGRAFVSLKPGQKLKPNDLFNYCQERLAKFKIPKYMSFLEELPKGDSGKLLKKNLPKQPEN